jgi:RNA polymerase sigma factor (sigma-70 family)
MAKTHSDLTSVPSDGELTLRAAKGDTAAFEELYRRHAPAAWRVAYAVTGNPHDASDAVSESFTRVFASFPAGRFPADAPFRPYLLAATRNAAIDGIRRAGKLQPSDIESLDFETAAITPGDAVVGALDSSLVATAFLSLPERWRSVLWLTEVEGLQPREIADMLGVSANGAAQLAVRARNGLRDQFLQAHLRAPVAKECRFTVDHLGAYVGGALSARDIAKVDQHLTGCETCRVRHAELEDVGSTLRKVALPLPLGLGGLAAARWKLVTASMGHTAERSWRLGAAADLPRVAMRPLAVGAGLLLALGIIGAAVVRSPSGPSLDARGRQAPKSVASPTPVVQGFALAPPPAAETIDEVASRQQALAAAQATAAAPASNPRQSTDTPPAGNGDGTTPPTPPPASESLLQLSASTPAAGVAAGDACTGVQLAGAVVVGCAPPAPAPTAALVTIETHGSLLGDNSISL